MSFFKYFSRSRKKSTKQEVQESIDTVLDDNFFIPINDTKENDIFIVGYPKSGNTWMQSLVSSLQYGIDINNLSDKLAQEIVPDVHARSYYKRFSTVNFFKSHHLPKKEYKKVIYIIRDGRDVITSYYFFKNKLGSKNTISDLIKDEALVFPCFWHKHVQEWMNNPFNSEILFVRYEDLKTDTFNQLKRIVFFANIEIDEDHIKHVSENSGIKKMRQRVVKTGGMGHKNWQNEKGADFFRKGITGDYKNHMSDIEIETFENMSSEILKKFKYIS